MNACPACGSLSRKLRISARDIRHETDLRENFVDRRLDHRPEALERMDLTKFMHGGAGRLVSCANCGLLFREEQLEADYRSDVYDPALMKHLYPRYLRAFELKKSAYLPLLDGRAEVLEVGSHLGAFLEAAEEWGWRPVGLDIGQATSDFARTRGLSVKRKALEDYSSPSRRPDAIFIWNCFEQLPEPGAALTRSYRLLSRNGLIVVRIPSAEFYRRTRRQVLAGKRGAALKSLAYNNLLGFPYLHGFTSVSLARILIRHGFTPIGRQNSSLLTPPYPDMPEWVQREWDAIRPGDRFSGADDGPWIEVVARRTPDV